MDWVSLLIDFAVYMVSMAICAIIMLGLIGSIAGSFLRLQKLRNWLITQEHKYRKLSTIVFMLCIFSVIIIFDLGIISGIIGGFLIAITFDPVPKDKQRKGSKKQKGTIMKRDTASKKLKPWRIIAAVICGVLLVLSVVAIVGLLGFPDRTIIKIGLIVFLSVSLVIAGSFIIIYRKSNNKKD
jgi:hypothetical protein